MAERLPRRTTESTQTTRTRTAKKAGHFALQATEAAQTREHSRPLQPVSGTVEKVRRSTADGNIGYVHLWVNLERENAVDVMRPQQEVAKETQRHFYHMGSVQWRQSETDHAAWEALKAEAETSRMPQPVGRIDLESSDCAAIARLAAEEKIATVKGQQLEGDVKEFLLSFASPGRAAI